MEFKKTENGFTYTPEEKTKPMSVEQRLAYLFSSVTLATIIFILMPKDTFTSWFTYIWVPVILLIGAFIGIIAVSEIAKYAASSSSICFTGKFRVLDAVMLIIYIGAMIFIGFLICVFLDGMGFVRL